MSITIKDYEFGLHQYFLNPNFMILNHYCDLYILYKSFILLCIISTYLLIDDCYASTKLKILYTNIIIIILMNFHKQILRDFSNSLACDNH